MIDAASWVQFSFEENLSGRGDFSLGVNVGSDYPPFTPPPPPPTQEKNSLG